MLLGYKSSVTISFSYGRSVFRCPKKSDFVSDFFKCFPIVFIIQRRLFETMPIVFDNAQKLRSYGLSRTKSRCMSNRSTASNSCTLQGILIMAKLKR
jgi:hypothetical protein